MKIEPSLSGLKEAKALYDGRGYTKVEQVFTAAEVADIRQNLVRYQTELAPQLPPRDVFQMDDNPELTISLSSMDRHDDYFLALRNDPRLKLMAETMLGEEAVPQNLEFFNILPGFGKPTPPHQDAVNLLAVENRSLVLWISLCHSDETNGSLRYTATDKPVARRHKAQWEGGQFVTNPYGKEDEAAEVSMTTNPGDVITHSTFTIHRSNPNSSSGQRWALGLPFISPQIKKVKSIEEWMEFSECPDYEHILPEVKRPGLKKPNQDVAQV